MRPFQNIFNVVVSNNDIKGFTIKMVKMRLPKK